MLIVDDNNKSIIIPNVHVPVTSTHFWVLDLQMLDFTLSKITMFEEYSGPSVAIEIEGFVFSVPKEWNILIADPEISTLDIIEIDKLAKQSYHVVVYDNERNFAHCSRVRIVDQSNHELIVNPSLNRHQMLCHPIGVTRWVCIAPNDSYNKYLKDLTIGNLL